MKCIVSRTSMYDSKPCEEAVLEEVTNYTDCTCKTIEKAMKLEWVRNGIPEQRKGFVRVYDKDKEKRWTIEFDNLTDLLKLYDKYGELIITDSGCKEIPIELEIYDTYRE